MKKSILAFVTFGLLVAADEPALASKEEMKKLQGTWTVSRVRRDGDLDSDLAEASVVITEDKFTSRSATKILANGTLKIDPAKKPKTIDIEYTDGPEKGQTVRGIYSLTDRTWILLLCPAGQQRPVSFKPESEFDYTFLVLKSAKP